MTVITKNIKIICCITLGIFFWVLPCPPVYGEYVGSETYGYTLDLPEGFVLTASSGNGSGYQLEHTFYPVDIVLRIYDAATYESAEKAMNSTLIKLSASAETSTVSWRNTESVISLFSMTIPGTYIPCKGWGICIPLPEEKGFFTMLAYAEDRGNAPDSPFFLYEPLILSALDAVHIDRGSFYSSGPVTTFAFPSADEIPVTLNINSVPIETTICASDTEAAQFLIEREFFVLKLFADTPLWAEAWQRYYRQIYRDSYGRLKKPAFDIYAALYGQLQGETTADKRKALLSTLLHWTQQMPYERSTETGDFAPLPAVLTGQSGSDCDSRALLLAILLKQMNFDTVLFISPVYSHALLGVAANGMKGARIAVNGTDYLLSETTASVEPGLVAEDIAVTENWMPVVFP